MEVARTKLGIGLQKVESGHFKGFGQGGIAMCKPFPSRLEKAVENLVIFDKFSRTKVVQSSCEEDM